MRIERIQLDSITYGRQPDKVVRDEKKTETADAITFEGERRRQDQSNNEREEHSPAREESRLPLEIESVPSEEADQPHLPAGVPAKKPLNVFV